jgi:hypothetical protein
LRGTERGLCLAGRSQGQKGDDQGPDPSASVTTEALNRLVRERRHIRADAPLVAEVGGRVGQ